MYQISERIQAASKKLKQIAATRQAFNEHVSAGLRLDNLRNRVSYTLAKALSIATLTEKPIGAELVKHIAGFNKARGTKLSLAKYEKLCWVRTINNGIHNLRRLPS